jgi:hypothetical protein
MAPGENVAVLITGHPKNKLIYSADEGPVSQGLDFSMHLVQKRPQSYRRQNNRDWPKS